MKKRFLELLLRTFGLIPSGVESYRTLGCGGEHEVYTGWRGKGLNENGDTVISFATPEGFNDAVADIIDMASYMGLATSSVNPDTFKV